jgi:hypothetical protein
VTRCDYLPRLQITSNPGQIYFCIPLLHYCRPVEPSWLSFSILTEATYIITAPVLASLSRRPLVPKRLSRTRSVQYRCARPYTQPADRACTTQLRQVPLVSDLICPWILYKHRRMCTYTATAASPRRHYATHRMIPAKTPWLSPSLPNRTAQSSNSQGSSWTSPTGPRPA